MRIYTSLEIRQYFHGHMIAEELDEGLEVLFVTQGRYNVGYQINKRNRYRRQFGESTIIGAFEICFKQRFQFLYQASSADLIGYAIRKKEWLSILNENLDFFLIFGSVLRSAAKNRKKCLLKAWHFFRSLAACCVPPPKIEKNAWIQYF